MFLAGSSPRSFPPVSFDDGRRRGTRSARSLCDGSLPVYAPVTAPNKPVQSISMPGNARIGAIPPPGLRTFIWVIANEPRSCMSGWSKFPPLTATGWGSLDSAPRPIRSNHFTQSTILLLGNA